MQKRGSASYTSEIIIRDSVVGKREALLWGEELRNNLSCRGKVCIETAEKYDFALSGGRIICVERIPDRSPGLADYRRRK
ncbi:MAG: hypothetical protein R2744_13390 [Bacteroidales bacterium]